MRLTQGAVSGLPVPTDGLKRDYFDDAIPGFGVRVSRKGKRVWIHRVYDRGRDTTKVLGSCTLITLAHAKQMIADRLLGLGPKPAANIQTFGELLDRYWNDHVLRTNTRTTIEQKDLFRREMDARFASHSMKDIDRSVVERWRMEMHDAHGPIAANRRYEMLRHMFAKAMDWGLADKNPAHGIKKFQQKSRERFLSEKEIPRWIAAVEQEPEPYRTYYMACLYTGARPGTGGGDHGEARLMRWADLDFDRKEWTIRDTKNKTDHVVPMVDDLVTMLDALPRTSEFVFAGERGKPINGFSRSWSRVKERSGLHNIRQHDIRRTFGAVLANRGMNMQQIMKAMNHKSVAAAQVYQRIADSAKLDAAKMMQEVIKGK